MSKTNSEPSSASGPGREAGDRPDNQGALVGWKAQDLHDRVVLRMQFVRTPPPHSRDDVHDAVFVLEKNQAVQLGNYLFEVSGQTRPARRGSWFSRLFG